MSKLIICIDGLGKDLVSEGDTPFLYNYGKENYISEFETLFAFTGLEYCFFTGKNPNESGIWLEFCYSRNSIFNNYFLRNLSFSKKLRDYFGAMIQLSNKRSWISGLHNIPKDKLKYFDTSMKENLWNLDFFKEKNFVFYKWPFFCFKDGMDKERGVDRFEKREGGLDRFGEKEGVVDKVGERDRVGEDDGVGDRDREFKVKIIYKYENDEERMNRLLSQEKKDIYYTQLMMVDKTIHKYGKYSKEAKNALRKIDCIVEKYVKKFLDKDRKGQVFIWSDHGFADIKKYINIEKYLTDNKGYFYFIAGTTAHFWFKNKENKEVVKDNLKNIDNIKILLEKDYIKYKIPKDKKYGDLIIYVEKGNYLFPNFYQKSDKERFVSMHGYPDDDELNGFLISNIKIPEKLKINEFTDYSL